MKYAVCQVNLNIIFSQHQNHDIIIILIYSPVTHPHKTRLPLNDNVTIGDKRSIVSQSAVCSYLLKTFTLLKYFAINCIDGFIYREH